MQPFLWNIFFHQTACYELSLKQILKVVKDLNSSYEKYKFKK